MRTYNDNFEAAHTSVDKTPLYVVEQFVDVAETDPVYFTNSDVCELPPGVTRPKDFVGSKLAQVIYPQEAIANGEFSGSLAMSDDGLTLVSSSKLVFGTTSGGVDVYTREGILDNWAYFTRLSIPPSLTGTDFGSAATISGDGETIVTSAPTDKKVFVYRLVDGFWSLVYTSTSTVEQYGHNLAVNLDGTMILVSEGAELSKDNVSVIENRDTTYPAVTSYSPPDTTHIGLKGSTAVSDDGTVFYVNRSVSEGYGGRSGEVHRYAWDRTGFTATRERLFTSPNIKDQGYFGVQINTASYQQTTPIACSSDGSIVVVGEYSGFDQRNRTEGAVHVFRANSEEVSLIETLKLPDEYLAIGGGAAAWGVSVQVSSDGLTLCTGRSSYWLGSNSTKLVGGTHVYRKTTGGYEHIEYLAGSTVPYTVGGRGTTVAADSRGWSIAVGVPFLTDPDDAANTRAGQIETHHIRPSIVFDSSIKNLQGVSQSMDRLAGTSSLGSISFDLIDYDRGITQHLRDKLVLGASVTGKVAKFYRGYPGLEFEDYVQFGTQVVEQLSQGKKGTLSISYVEVLALKKDKIFDLGRTNLTTEVLVADPVIEVGSTSGFSQVDHGPRYSEAPMYAVGLVSVTQLSVTVTGSGTSWLSKRIGYNSRIEIEATVYLVDRVDSDTQLILQTAFNQVSVVNVAYKVYPFLFYFMIQDEIVNSAGRVASLVSNTSTGFGFVLDGSDWYISGMAGLESAYPVGSQIHVSGSSGNDGAYIVSPVDFAGRLYITGTFSAEAAGASVNVLANVQFYDCSRGARGSVAAAHPLSVGALPSRQPEVSEVAYLTMPGPMMALALITNTLYTQARYKRVPDLVFPELNTGQNATNTFNQTQVLDPSSDIDSTFGYVNVGCDTFDSVTYGSVELSELYTLLMSANTTPTANARVHTDLAAAPYNLEEGKHYHLLVKAKHVGTGGLWRIYLQQLSDQGFGLGPPVGSLFNTATSFAGYALDFRYSSAFRYLVFMEQSGTDDGGMSVNKVSIRETLELVSDVSFDTGWFWAWSTQVSQLAGKFGFAVTSGVGSISQADASYQEDTSYQVTITIGDWVAGFVTVRLGDSSVDVTGADGTYTYTLTTTTFSNYARGVTVDAVPTTTLSVTSISVKEVVDVDIDAQLPASYGLGLSERFVDVDSFKNVGNDLWDQDDQSGIAFEFFEKEPTEGKRFLERELYRILGAVAYVSDSGRITYKQLQSVLFDAATVGTLDRSNAIFSSITHRMPALANRYVVEWDYDPVTGDSRQREIVIDKTSIDLHRAGKVLHYAMHGISRDAHSRAFIFSRVDSFRDGYSGPPVLAEVKALPSQDKYQIGDVVYVESEDVSDFTSTTGDHLARAMEVQRVSIDYPTGNLSYKVFGSSRQAGLLAPQLDATALLDSFYSVAGGLLAANKLDAVAGLTTSVDGSGILHITAVTGAAPVLPGHASDSGQAIYWYDGPVQIDASVVVTFGKNIRLYIMGTLVLQSGAKLDGKGSGSSNAEPAVGYIGSTQPGGGMVLGQGRSYRSIGSNGYIYRYWSYLLDGTTAQVASLPYFDVVNVGGTQITGVPKNLIGLRHDTSDIRHRRDYPTLGGLLYEAVSGEFSKVARVLSLGGAHGPAGAGCTLLCRNLVCVSGAEIDLSGDDGATPTSYTLGPRVVIPGGGAGGHPGGLLVLLDGKGATAIGVEDALVANTGETPMGGDRSPAPRVELVRERDQVFDPPTGSIHSYYEGSGPSVSRKDSCLRIQKLQDQ